MTTVVLLVFICLFHCLHITYKQLACNSFVTSFFFPQKCLNKSIRNEIIYHSTSVGVALSLHFSFSIAKSFKWSLLNSNSLWNDFPKNTYFIEKVLKLLQMTGGGKFYFRPKEGLFAADNLSTFSVYLSNKICNLSL